jgi:hypothetical protein
MARSKRIHVIVSLSLIILYLLYVLHNVAHDPSVLEGHRQFVSSRGLMQCCDVFPQNPISSIRQCYDYDWDTLKSHATVYIPSSAIPDFIKRIWPTIKVPIILVSGDCDELVPNDIFSNGDAALAFVKDARLIAWFAQNMIPFHSKTFQIPIGIDYHTLSASSHNWGAQQTPLKQERELLALRNRTNVQKPLIYANFHFSMKTRYGKDREAAVQEISKALIYYEAKPVPRFLTWTSQHEYAFVASPWGNGLDCHRTWEALALGCYPILHSSYLDPMFLDLPILIVTAWSEVTRERLDAFLKDQEGTPKAVPEKLRLKYWTDKINLFKGSTVSRDEMAEETAGVITPI